jgi:GH25 family lysozyme M1 (1,4-beta-N-acetylmuramidase)/uncharacterized protein YraI
MTTGTPGIDVSHHQDRVDWKKVAAAGYRFAVIRASYGSDVKDRRFETHWEGAQQAGLRISSYHFLLPEQPVDVQMSLWFNTLGSRRPDFPLVLDVEKNSTGMPREAVTAVVRECLNRIQQRDGRKAIIYTRGSFWNRQILPSSDWAQHDLWVANYVANPAVTLPGLPTDWKQWRFWQYSESGQVPGISGNVDLNWFNGASDQLMAYTGGSSSPIPVPIPTPPPPQGARVIVDALNVRSGFGTQYPVVGQLRKNDSVTIAALSGSEIWVNLAANQWAAFTYNGQTFMELLPRAGAGLYQVRVTTNRLNVRLTPSTSSPVVASLTQGQVVSVLDLDGPEVWLNIAPGKWVAMIFGGSRFVALS